MTKHFISIEGIEGAGKSTAIKIIQAYLVKAGFDVVLTREPGGTPLAEELRHILLNPESKEVIDPKTELLLMFAGRAQHLQEVIIPSLEAGKWVVSDRFVDASFAYQGAGRGLDEKYLNELEAFVVGKWKPELTILLDLEPELGLARSKQRGPQDRFEQERVEFFAKVRHAYLSRAKADPERFQIIDASQSLEQVEARLNTILNKMIRV